MSSNPKSAIRGPQSRTAWMDLSDDNLLSQCEVDTYRASGPGGQKRNKTSSAVRLRHPPSGLIVIAEESRSQHENKAKALRRLRRAFALEVREPFLLAPPDSDDAAPPVQLPLQAGRLKIRAKDERFWPTVGIVLDVLSAAAGKVSDAASALGITTGNLIAFLELDPKVWQQANVIRAQAGHKPLQIRA
jgi:hypothetical protein